LTASLAGTLLGLGALRAPHFRRIGSAGILQNIVEL
jgi:hypothetical protein